MTETTDGFGLVLLGGFMVAVAVALFLYGALSSEHSTLRDEIATLRAEVRCFAEQEDCDSHAAAVGARPEALSIGAAHGAAKVRRGGEGARRRLGRTQRSLLLPSNTW